MLATSKLGRLSQIGDEDLALLLSIWRDPGRVASHRHPARAAEVARKSLAG